jgi:transposase InsO family protein
MKAGSISPPSSTSSPVASWAGQPAPTTTAPWLSELSTAPSRPGHPRPASSTTLTDRGSVYASGDYSAALNTLAAVKSMSRKGDCWDNAVAESFFATIKGELIHNEDYKTRTAAIHAIGKYIDGFYNLTRRHSAIDYISPVEFEMAFALDGLSKVAT